MDGRPIHKECQWADDLNRYEEVKVEWRETGQGELVMAGEVRLYCRAKRWAGRYIVLRHDIFSPSVVKLHL